MPEDLKEQKKERLRVLAKTGGTKAGRKNRDNPARVAKEVIEQIKKKELVSVKDAMLKVGYSKSTAGSKMGEITRKPSYIAVMNNFEESLKEKTAMTLHSIQEKDLKKATLRDKTYTFDILNKNYNLLTGKPTSNIASIGTLLITLEQQAKDNKDKGK